MKCIVLNLENGFDRQIFREIIEKYEKYLEEKKRLPSPKDPSY